MADRETHPQWKPEYKPDVAYLHVIPRSRAKCVINISPFAIKLELWMRLNNIPFETIDCMQFSSKGQSPFILFNEKEIPDSNFIVEFLSKKFNKDLYPGLSKTDRAVARAFLKMSEEDMTWPIFMHRYVEHVEEYGDYLFTLAPPEQRQQVQAMLQTSVANRANGHGIGRHSPEERQKIGCDDVQAISDFLGDKQFIMGDQPTLLDCSVFGVLSQVLYVPMSYPMRKHILEHCPNVLDLCNRLKDTYWKDWEEQCRTYQEPNSPQ